MTVASFLLLRRFLLRHLRAGLPRLGEADGDGLLAALHLLARASALERAALPLVHRPFDLLRGFLAVLARHVCNLLHSRMCKRYSVASTYDVRAITFAVRRFGT